MPYNCDDARRRFASDAASPSISLDLPSPLYCYGNDVLQTSSLAFLAPVPEVQLYSISFRFSFQMMTATALCLVERSVVAMIAKKYQQRKLAYSSERLLACNLVCLPFPSAYPILHHRCEKALLCTSSVRWTFWNNELCFGVRHPLSSPVPQTARCLSRSHRQFPCLLANYVPVYSLLIVSYDIRIHCEKRGNKSIAEDRKGKKEGIMVHDVSHIHKMVCTLMNREL